MRRWVERIGMDKCLLVWREGESEKVFQWCQTWFGFEEPIISIEEVMRIFEYLRVRLQSSNFRINLRRVSSVSEKERWYVQASIRLDSARAIAYASISSGSVRSGLAVRTYVRMRVLASSDRERACNVFEG